MMVAKSSVRDKEYEIRKSLYDEIRGLRRMLRIEGYTDIDPVRVRAHAKDAEGTEGAERVPFGGETHLKRLKEHAKDAEGTEGAERVLFGGETHLKRLKEHAKDVEGTEGAEGAQYGGETQDFKTFEGVAKAGGRAEWSDQC